MTRKIYKSAMGKTVDLGALLLQNEQVRAVGNMGVNAAGDLVDGTNNIIEQRHRQVQRQYQRQTNVSNTTVASSNLSARKIRAEKQESIDNLDLDLSPSNQDSQLLDQPSPVTEPIAGGLAAAIARSREVKQELEKTMRQRTREQGIKKI